MVADDEVIRGAYAPSLAGATVPLDGTVPIGGVAQVGSLTLVGGIAVPWSVVLAPMSPAGGNPGDTPNRLRVTLGLHGGGVTFDVDAPLTGGILALPPAESLTLGLVVNNIFAALPGKQVASQRVSFAPAHHGLPAQSMPLTYTLPMKNLGIGAGITYDRPPMSTGYRFVASTDPAGYSIVASQLVGVTTVQADTSSATTTFGAAYERTNWLPLSPLCSQLLVINGSAAVRDIGVIWRIGDW